jgi:hypothetical protein
MNAHRFKKEFKEVEYLAVDERSHDYWVGKTEGVLIDALASVR